MEQIEQEGEYESDDVQGTVEELARFKENSSGLSQDVRAKDDWLFSVGPTGKVEIDEDGSAIGSSFKVVLKGDWKAEIEAWIWGLGM